MVFMVYYREKLICNACDGGGRTDERRKVENRAVFCWTRNRNKKTGKSSIVIGFINKQKCNNTDYL